MDGGGGARIHGPRPRAANRIQCPGATVRSGREARIVSKAWSNQQAATKPYISYGLVVDGANDASAATPHYPASRSAPRAGL